MIRYSYGKSSALLTFVLRLLKILFSNIICFKAFSLSDLCLSIYVCVYLYIYLKIFKLDFTDIAGCMHRKKMYVIKGHALSIIRK